MEMSEEQLRDYVEFIKFEYNLKIQELTTDLKWYGDNHTDLISENHWENITKPLIKRIEENNLR